MSSARTSLSERLLVSLITPYGDCVVTEELKVLECTTDEARVIVKGIERGEIEARARYGVIDLDSKTMYCVIDLYSGSEAMVSTLASYCDEKVVERVLEFLKRLGVERVTINRGGKVSVYDSELGWVGEIGSYIPRSAKDIVMKFGLYVSKKWLERLEERVNELAMARDFEGFIERCARLVLDHPIAVIGIGRHGAVPTPYHVSIGIGSEEVNPWEVKGLTDTVEYAIYLPVEGNLVPPLLELVNRGEIRDSVKEFVATVLHEALHVARDISRKATEGGWFFGVPVGEERTVETTSRSLTLKLFRSDPSFTNIVNETYRRCVATDLAMYMDIIDKLARFVAELRLYDAESSLAGLSSARNGELCFVVHTSAEVWDIVKVARDVELAPVLNWFGPPEVCVRIER